MTEMMLPCCFLPGCQYDAAVVYFQALVTKHYESKKTENKRTLVSLIERCDGLAWPKGEVLVHQNVMKTNLKTAGCYE